MTAVVIDTNLIVSALLRPDGMPAELLRLALGGEVEFFVSVPILAEYEEVLRRPRFGFAPVLVSELMEAIRTTAWVVAPLMRVEAAADSDDNMFLDCAETVGASFLVTGNTKHFPPTWKATRIVTVREFLELWQFSPTSPC